MPGQEGRNLVRTRSDRALLDFSGSWKRRYVVPPVEIVCARVSDLVMAFHAFEPGQQAPTDLSAMAQPAACDQTRFPVGDVYDTTSAKKKKRADQSARFQLSLSHRFGAIRAPSAGVPTVGFTGSCARRAIPSARPPSGTRFLARARPRGFEYPCLRSGW
jgi:hypothetical protein